MKKTVTVEFEIEVELDESKFTFEFMEEFRKDFYDFNTIDQHFEHLAWLEARQMLDGFVEGYCEIKDMGIKAKVVGERMSVS